MLNRAERTRAHIGLATRRPRRHQGKQELDISGKPHPRPDQRRRNGKPGSADTATASMSGPGMRRENSSSARAHVGSRWSPRSAGRNDLCSAQRLASAVIAARVGGDPIDIDAAIEQRLLARQLRQPPLRGARVDAGDQQPPALVVAQELERLVDPLRTAGQEPRCRQAWPEKPPGGVGPVMMKTAKPAKNSAMVASTISAEQLAQAPRGRPAALSPNDAPRLAD